MRARFHYYFAMNFSGVIQYCADSLDPLATMQKKKIHPAAFATMPVGLPVYI
jgi:hypothetical protein